MSKSYFSVVRFMGKVVAAVVVLIAIVIGVVSYLEIGENTSSQANTPKVKFSNFEEFKNLKSNELSDDELRALKENFQEEFLDNFELIAKNISIYSDATKQVRADEEVLEEQLFKIVSKYDYPERTAFLTQLLKETSNLVSYSEVMATDDTKAKIEWTEFMNWFVSDFDYQLNSNVSKAEYVTIEASIFEKAAIAGIVIILVLLGIMMSLLLRRDSKANPIVVAAKEPAKAATKAPATKAAAKKKPVEKKKETVKKAEEKKEETK